MPRNATSNGRSATNKPSAKGAAATKPSTEKPEAANPVVLVDTEPEQETAPATRIRAKVTELDPNMYISVRNGFNGKLIYVSRKTNERFVWEKFGDEQDMELRELRAAKTSYKSFFENNWFLIDDPAVIEYLGVEKFYKNALDYEGFDTLFELTPEKIEEKISLLSKGQKASLKYRAQQLIQSGSIDSLKVINTLEKSLGIELIEK